MLANSSQKCLIGDQFMVLLSEVRNHKVAENAEQKHKLTQKTRINITIIFNELTSR